MAYACRPGLQAHASTALSFIRTMTVDPGIAPDLLTPMLAKANTGRSRVDAVACNHRRWGISPRPENAALAGWPGLENGAVGCRRGQARTVMPPRQPKRSPRPPWAPAPRQRHYGHVVRALICARWQKSYRVFSCACFLKNVDRTPAVADQPKHQKCRWRNEYGCSQLFI